MGRRKKHKSHGSSQNSRPLNFFVSNRQKVLPLNASSVKKVMKELCQFLSVSGEEISIFFVTKKKISSLHQKFFNDPSPTDCITFPIDDSYLGDLIICPATAIEYAAKHDLDPYLETQLYLVHGLLHLLKYDDQTPDERRQMRKMEKKCMDHLYKLKLRL